MGALKSTDVFLSYAEEDGAAALHIAEDLARAKLKVWRYERDSKLGTPIVEETRRAIEKSRCFCLLDSAHARLSSYIRTECAAARELMARDENFSLIVCLLQKRDDEGDGAWWRDELFAGLNSLSYVDLSDYERGIKRLCAHLGVVYFPKSEIPRDCDFEREAYAAGLQHHEITELVGFYSNFRRLYSDHSEIAEAQLLVLVERLRGLKAATVVSPLIALGVLQAESGQHRAAQVTFSQLVQICADDPRAWAGLAGARFHLAEYQEALDAYRHAQRLLAQEDPEHQAEMAHNAARTLLALGRADEAWAELSTIEDEPYVVAAKAAVLFTQGQAARALSLFETAFRAYRRSPSLPSSLVIQYADCLQALRQDRRELELIEEALTLLPDDPEIHRRAASCYLVRNRVSRALACLDRAVALAPAALVYRAERALILRLAGDPEAARRMAHGCLSPEDESPRERYYRGLAFYLLGAEEAANVELLQSRRDPALKHWPTYADLVGSS